MADSPRVLVARFLLANNYNETLETFINEADLSPGTGTLETGDLTIEKILEEKRLFDVSFNFEKLNINKDIKGWSQPAPAVPKIVDTLPHESNVLHVAIRDVIYDESRSDPATHSSLMVTTADRQCYFLETGSPYELRQWDPPLYDAPILSSVLIRNRYLITTSMSGQISMFDCQNKIEVDKRRDHKKYVVKAVYCEEAAGILLATAAWDLQIIIYRMDIASSDTMAPKFGSPAARIELKTNPEDILFVPHPESSKPVLVVTRRDSSSMYYYALDNIQGSSPELRTRLLGQQNLAPNSNAWIAFSPSSIAICPTDPSTIAVATSAIPHMKMIIVRMLLPPFTGGNSSQTSTELTQASQSRAALAVQDREAAAIMIHCNTMAPQTQYSTPSIAWRPDGSGVWVNGDDGAIRGIEMSTGKTVAVLKGAHEAGVKVRCLWSGLVGEHQGNKVEVVVSGGFDRRLVIWNTISSAG